MEEINTHGVLIKKLGKIENILNKYLPECPLFEKSKGEDENLVENNEHLSIINSLERDGNANVCTRFLLGISSFGRFGIFHIFAMIS